MSIVDLSAPLAEENPCTWPGHIPFVHRIWRDFGESSVYKTHCVVIDEHCGTHFDAAPHFIPPEGAPFPLAGPLGLKGGDRVDLASLCGPAAVIDVKDLCSKAKPGESPWITKDCIADWEQANGALKKGDIVLFASGWSDKYKAGKLGYDYITGPVAESSTPGWPAPDLEAIRYLRDRGLTTVGTEAPSLGAVQGGAPVHQEGLGCGMHYIEGLCGLKALPSRGAYFVFLPLKIVDSTGCPGRAIALLPEGSTL